MLLLRALRQPTEIFQMMSDPLSPLSKAISHIGQIFVKHRDAELTREFLDQLGQFRLREMETAYIRGWSRCGKSEIVKRWIHRKTGRHVTPKPPVQLLEGNGLRIIYVDLTGSSTATPMQVSQMIGVKALGCTKLLSLKELAVTDTLIEQLAFNKIDMVIIDESQNMLRSLGEKGAWKLAPWVLAAENARAFQLLLVGALFLELLTITVDAADARQAGCRLVGPFAFNDAGKQLEYKSFVKAFVDQLQHCKSNWISESLDTARCFETLHSLFYVDRGRPGSFAKLIEHAHESAYRTDGNFETLTKEHFRDAFDLRYLSNAKYAGLNPFRDEDYARLPKFPLSADQTEADAQMREFVKTTIKHRKGGRLWGKSNERGPLVPNSPPTSRRGHTIGID
jgi:hypothetical protein